MIKRILFILVLCLLIITPCFAWSEVFTNNTGTALGHLHSSRSFSGLVVNDIQKVDDGLITRFDWAGEEDWSSAYGGTAYTEKTMAVPLYIGASLVGNGTWYRGVCTQNGGSGFSTVSSHRLDIIDFSTALTGRQTITFFSDGWSNAEIKGRYMHGTYNTFSTYPFSDSYSFAPIGVEYPYSFSVTNYGGTAIPPHTNYTINVEVKNLADTPLEDFYVEVIPYDFIDNRADLTDVNGKVYFTDMSLPDENTTVNVHVMSSGIYTSYDQYFEITGNPTNITAIMVSASPSGTYRNITYHIQDTNSNLIAGVFLDHIVSPDFQLGDVSNLLGNVTFNNVPVVNNYATYSVEQSNNPSWQTQIGGVSFSTDVYKVITLQPTSYYPTPTPTGLVTVTPTPIGQYALYLSAFPDSINLGDSITLTGSASSPTVLTYAGGLRRTSFYVNIHPSTYPFDYNMIGQFENVNATYWKFRANTGATWNTPTTASPLTMTNIPSSNGLITYSFNAYDTTGNTIAQSGTDDVLVGGGAGGGSLTISSSAYDASNGNHLSNFQLNITDDASGVVTEFGNVSYEREITLPRGNSYTLRASKEGYISDGITSGIKQFIVPPSLNIQKGDFGAIFNVPMFATGSVTAGNTTVSVRVYDVSTYYPLPNVQLTNSYAPTDIKYTVDASAVSWVLPQNTGYTLTAYKDGYCTITESKNTSTNSYQYVPIYMKFGGCAGATVTPTPTGTPTPTITPIGGWGNTTGEAIVCGNLPEDATIIDILKNSLACNGLEDAQSQNLGIAMLIILFAAIVLGRIAKGIGVLAGVIAGTVLSTVAGFLPFWIIIVVIIIAGLVFAGKVFWSSGQ